MGHIAVQWWASAKVPDNEKLPYRQKHVFEESMLKCIKDPDGSHNVHVILDSSLVFCDNNYRSRAWCRLLFELVVSPSSVCQLHQLLIRSTASLPCHHNEIRQPFR